MSSPVKKQKTTANKKFYKSEYKVEWAREFPISAANNNKYAFYCVPCKKNVSCGHQGKADVERHCTTASHRNMASAIKDNRSISDLFQSSTNSSDSLRQSTTKAEILHTNFIVQHNMSFLTADHMTHLYPKMFPDSKIAKQFACSRTKTSCILNNAMMPNLHDYIVSYMKEQPYSLVNDGSSDSGVDKMNPVCALIFDMCVTTCV
jgi:hypothetical protein